MDVFQEFKNWFDFLFDQLSSMNIICEKCTWNFFHLLHVTSTNAKRKKNNNIKRKTQSETKYICNSTPPTTSTGRFHCHRTKQANNKIKNKIKCEMFGRRRKGENERKCQAEQKKPFSWRTQLLRCSLKRVQFQFSKQFLAAFCLFATFIYT